VGRGKEKAEPEAVFLNFYEAKESIPRNLFRQAMCPGGPLRQPFPTQFLDPIDCSKIPAQNCYHATTKKRSKKGPKGALEFPRF
jgi:hypothetical protein